MRLVYGMAAACLGTLACTTFGVGAVAGQDASTDGPTDAGQDGLPSATDAASPGLILYLPFDRIDGTRTPDLSGQQHDATLVGGPVLTSGHVKSALKLAGPPDGADGGGPQYATAPLPGGISRGLTLAMWLNLADTQRDQRLLTANGITLKLNGGKPQLVADVTGGCADASVRPAAKIDAVWAFGAFHHLAITFVDGTVTMYVDGSEAPQTIDAEPFCAGMQLTMTTARTLYVGSDVNVDDNLVASGSIDELRVYDVGLSPADIAVLAR